MRVVCMDRRSESTETLRRREIGLAHPDPGALSADLIE